MQRDLVVRLIQTELIKKNSGHYSYDAKAHADEILTVLERLGIVHPTHNVVVQQMDMLGFPYEEVVTVSGWAKDEG